MNRYINVVRTVVIGLFMLAADCRVALVLATVPARAACPLVPVPKVYQEKGGRWDLRPPQVAAIVLGDKASDPEKYAAERLQAALKQKTGGQYRICTEDQLPAQATQVFLLGQASTNRLLDQLCRKHKLDLSEKSPGHDGFVLEMIEDAARQVVLIGGSDPRGVIYGQATFVNLLTKQGTGWGFPRVSVRDWPSIKWRAFTQNNLDAYLEPGRLDRYVDARLNFIELRDGPPPGRGHFGVPPDFELDRGRCKTLLHEAHRRGFFVYGVVFCGVKPEKHDATFKQFQVLKDLGVDGLYVSFDDPGGGVGQDKLVARVVEFARVSGYTGHRLAMLPPSGHYQKVDTPFNRKLAAVPGFANATWFFTSVPCAADVDARKRIGLEKAHGWWHNWPIAQQGGFCLTPKYLPLLKLENGWGKPTYETLRNAAQVIDSAIVWVRGMDEYLNQVFGIWAWAPETHDWPAIQQFVYSRVFGPSLVEPARQFDARLQEFMRLLKWEGPGDWNVWVIRLADVKQRPKALELLREMEASLKALEARAPAETSLTAERLQKQFLGPMRDTLRYGRLMAELEFPDHVVSRETVGQKVKGLLRAGKEEEAREYLAQVREKVNPLLENVSRELGSLRQAQLYMADWQRLLDVNQWKRQLKTVKPRG